MQNLPELKIERRKVADLRPAPKNPRTHSQSQILKLADSIREWGWTVPVLIGTDNEIIAGHGRVEAAKHLGMIEVPVIIADGWTREQRRAYIIADNQLPTSAGWDFDLVAEELGDLEAAGFDIGKIGFSESELSAFFTTENAPLSDGVGSERDEREDAADGQVRIGPYKTNIPREKMAAWLTMIRNEGNDDKNEIIAAILARLGI
jgi:hypothetical protein